MRQVRENLGALASAHTGRLGVVLGGGPSLPVDLATVPMQALNVGVNHHAPRLVDCHYIVMNDAHNTQTGEAWEDLLRGKPGIRVSPIDSVSDVRPAGLVDTGQSGTTALWFAAYVGCDPIVVCGVDGYTGDRDYWWNGAGEQPCRDWRGAEVMARHYPLSRCAAARLRGSFPAESVAGYARPRHSASHSDSD